MNVRYQLQLRFTRIVFGASQVLGQGIADLHGTVSGGFGVFRFRVRVTYDGNARHWMVSEDDLRWDGVIPPFLQGKENVKAILEGVDVPPVLSSVSV